MPVSNLRQKKAELRAKHKKLRQSFAPEKKREADERIARRFLSLKEYKNCSTLLGFVPKDIEVNTYPILEAALSDGKTLAVPRCDTEKTEMEFFEITSFDDLEKGCYGLLEPKKSCEKNEVFSRALCLVPALAFDRGGFRIGFGKGYYDRFLAGFGGVSVGVCYSRCVEPELPRGGYDRPIDIVVTEEYLIEVES